MQSQRIKVHRTYNIATVTIFEDTFFVHGEHRAHFGALLFIVDLLQRRIRIDYAIRAIHQIHYHSVNIGSPPPPRFLLNLFLSRSQLMSFVFG